VKGEKTYMPPLVAGSRGEEEAATITGGKSTEKTPNLQLKSLVN